MVRELCTLLPSGRCAAQLPWQRRSTAGEERGKVDIRIYMYTEKVQLQDRSRRRRSSAAADGAGSSSPQPIASRRCMRSWNNRMRKQHLSTVAMHMATCIVDVRVAQTCVNCHDNLHGSFNRGALSSSSALWMFPLLPETFGASTSF